MPIKKNQVSFDFDLSDYLDQLDDYELSQSKRLKIEKKINKEVGEYLLSSILDFVGDGKSPVAGESFKRLNAKYANEEKAGDKTPNLDLNGDMLNALTVKSKSIDKVTIGIFDSKEAIKAYAHNTGFKDHPVLEGKGLKRQFIPDKDQELKREILRDVKDLVKEIIDNEIS